MLKLQITNILFEPQTILWREKTFLKVKLCKKESLRKAGYWILIWTHRLTSWIIGSLLLAGQRGDTGSALVFFFKARGHPSAFIGPGTVIRIIRHI